MNRNLPHSWLVTLPLALVAGSYVWFVFLPGKRAISELEIDLAAKRAFIADSSRVTLGTSHVEKQRAAAEAYCRIWKAQSSDSSHLAALYGRIAEMLKSSGVTTTRFSPEPAQKLELLARIPLRIGCEGSLPQIAAMLASLEAMPERIWIEDINVEPTSNAAQTPPTPARPEVRSPQRASVAGKVPPGVENRQTMHCELSLGIFAVNSEKSDQRN